MTAQYVIGIDLDYEVLGQGGSMLMVSANGTAVTFDDCPRSSSGCKSALMAVR